MNLLLHFWIAIGLFALAALGLQREVRREAALALAAGGAILIVGSAGIGAPLFASADGAGGETLKVIAFNLWEENRSPRAAAEWILAERPDVIALIEAKGGAATVPALIADAYPYRLSCQRNERCSTLILSRRRPSAAVPLAQGDAENRRALSAALMEFGNAAVIGVHLSRPYPLGSQRRDLEDLETVLVGLQGRDLVLLGDFNANMSTFAMRGLAARYGLVPALSWTPTWPAPAPFIALDHVLVGPGWSVKEVRRGPALGSDHYPLVATLRRKVA